LRQTLDEFYRVSVCFSVKEMCDMLEVTHEETEEVKRARKKYSGKRVWDL